MHAGGGGGGEGTLTCALLFFFFFYKFLCSTERAVYVKREVKAKKGGRILAKLHIIIANPSVQPLAATP
jgi:hypothetical protein